MPHPVDYLPTAEVLVEMPKEELAEYILKYLDEQGKTTLGGVFGRVYDDSEHQGFPRMYRQSVWDALAAAWAWLEGQALIIESDSANGPNGFRKPSREGKMLLSEDGFGEFVYQNELPVGFLHPAILGKSASHLRRGEFDIAVFTAFREIEIRVREFSRAEQNAIGVTLMRQAFHKDTGPLTDTSLPIAEREHLGALFAASIGIFKNPHSHRDAPLDDPREAFDSLMLASQLMRRLDKLQVSNRD